jgi:MoxR-like ATPase
VVRTTSDVVNRVTPLFTAQEIIDFQPLIRRIPVADNVIEYVLVSKTRPDNGLSNDYVKSYLDWGWAKSITESNFWQKHMPLLVENLPRHRRCQSCAIGFCVTELSKNYKADAEG